MLPGHSRALAAGLLYHRCSYLHRAVPRVKNLAAVELCVVHLELPKVGRNLYPVGYGNVDCASAGHSGKGMNHMSTAWKPAGDGPVPLARRAPRTW
jgi:hypothetical protein